MERKELIIAIRNYFDTLSEEEKYCNGCENLQVNKFTGARGQIVTAFNDGICRCNEQELMWAYRGYKVDRPIECILNGDKYIKTKGD